MSEKILHGGDRRFDALLYLIRKLARLWKRADSSAIFFAVLIGIVGRSDVMCEPRLVCAYHMRPSSEWRSFGGI
jgi:hypothetical protein